MNIFFDLDNTLLDTTTAACKFHGIECPYDNNIGLGKRDIHNLVGMTWEDFWLTLPTEFWATIPKYPWCDQIIEKTIDLIGVDSTFILTSPIPNSASPGGKQLWINNHFPKLINNVFIGHKKHIVVDKESYLIDDSYKNEKRFIDAGKRENFFLFPATENKLYGIVPSMINNPDIAIDMVITFIKSKMND